MLDIPVDRVPPVGDLLKGRKGEEGWKGKF